MKSNTPPSTSSLSNIEKPRKRKLKNSAKSTESKSMKLIFTVVPSVAEIQPLAEVNRGDNLPIDNEAPVGEPLAGNDEEVPMEEPLAENGEEIAMEEALENDAQIEPVENKILKDCHQYYLTTYCRQNDGISEFYATDSAEKPYYLFDQMKNKNVYAKRSVIVNDSAELIEHPIVDGKGETQYIMDYSVNTIEYPINFTTGRPIYEVDSETGDEIYSIHKNTGLPVYGLDINKCERYAKNAEGHETPIVIDNIPRYAQDIEANQIYPQTNENTEFYIRVGDTHVAAMKWVNGQLLPYYAKSAVGSEIYPLKFTRLDITEDEED